MILSITQTGDELDLLFFSPATGKGDSLGDLRALRFLAGDPRDSSPPAAAPAAGGRGIPGSGLCELGVRGECRRRRWGGSDGAGGVCWWWTSPPVVRLCELRRRSAARPLLAALRRPRGGVPFAGVRGRWIRRLTIWRLRFMKTKVVSPAVVRGGGVPAPRSVDSLSTGGPPVQAYGDGAADFAGAASSMS